jgi:hypothetical protein
VPDIPDADSPDDIDRSRVRLAWEIPEIAAVAVLMAVGALIVGGLVAGIVASTPTYVGTSARFATGNAISFGAFWAGPPLAIALLGVVGLSWWQLETWRAASEPDDERDQRAEAAGHMRRAHRISQWSQVALLLICAGAVALVVSSTLLSTGGVNSNSADWARVVVEAANLLAIVVVAGAGIWIARKVTMDEEPSDWGSGQPE